MGQRDVEPFLDEGVLLSSAEEGSPPYFAEVKELVSVKLVLKIVDGSLLRPMLDGRR